MHRMGQSTADMILITDQGTQHPMRAFVQQLEYVGYEVHAMPRLHYDTTASIPMPRAVFVDVASQYYLNANNLFTGIRATWEYVPLLLVVRATEVGQVNFSSGLHDFITLPINLPELEARLRFTQVKTRGVVTPQDELRLPGFSMNLATYEVLVENNPVELTHKEFELLKFFIKRPRRVFTRAELLDAVWQCDYYGGTRTVDVHIRRLRAKLGDGIGNMIHTVRNVGYRFG